MSSFGLSISWWNNYSNSLTVFSYPSFRRSKHVLLKSCAQLQTEWQYFSHICEGWFSWPLLQHNWVKHSGDCVTIFKTICIMSFSQLSKMWLLPSRCLQLSEGADLYVNTSLWVTRALRRIQPMSGPFASSSQYTTASIYDVQFQWTSVLCWFCVSVCSHSS